MIKEEKWKLFNQSFEQLGKDCKQLLKLFFEGNPMKTIAEVMGHSPAYVKLKKFNCKKKLIDLIKKDQRYTELAQP